MKQARPAGRATKQATALRIFAGRCAGEGVSGCARVASRRVRCRPVSASFLCRQSCTERGAFPLCRGCCQRPTFVKAVPVQPASPHLDRYLPPPLRATMTARLHAPVAVGVASARLRGARHMRDPTPGALLCPVAWRLPSRVHPCRRPGRRLRALPAMCHAARCRMRGARACSLDARVGRCLGARTTRAVQTATATTRALDAGWGGRTQVQPLPAVSARDQ